MTAPAKPNGGLLWLNREVAIKFALGGVSCCCAAMVTNPVDVVKTRMQLQGELGSTVTHRYPNILGGLGKLVRDEGLRGYYSGIQASLMREATYSTIRLGAYEPFKEMLGATDPAHTPIWKKIAAGCMSGMVGAAIANPTDLVKVRQQAELPGAPRRYANTFQAFRIIWKEGGMAALYRGVGPTTKRAAILTSSQLASYDHSKHIILNRGLLEEGNLLHFSCSILAGLVCAVTTSPIDNIKTRVMNQPLTPDGRKLYRNSWDCFVKTLKAEGVTGLYKGFYSQWLRIGPHTIVAFVVLEKLRTLVNINPI
eukprot:TRINITY_DN10824_c0_g1_i1.p1 TRINITY_DN10824_c0_g1~~TRINITY_DN10824_c0_g1_i1.p1  ORF type:complete len:310 (-),score=23.00 TRINITY_DN10824_c0_g1_i1:67-996(-)